MPVTNFGRLTPRQIKQWQEADELGQRRLLRFVERITGMKLPASKFGVVIIDASGHNGGCLREQ